MLQRPPLKGGESGGAKSRASSNYWSSTENSDNNAYNVNFDNGNVNNNNKNNNNSVRAVRSSKQPGRLPSLFSFKNIYRAYIKCRRRKRNTCNALKYELSIGENLLKLQWELKNRVYKPGRSVVFATTRPKLREIFAAGFKDRVVHHILVTELEKIWEPKFIYDSWACRKGKGVHGAVKRLRRFLRKITSNSTVRAYYLQLDVRSFFNSIDKNILFEIISSKINDEKLLWLAETLIFHDPTNNYILKGKKELVYNIPPHKSLFPESSGRGMPIGNLTSQFFANVYLDRLDRFVKHNLKCRYYLRYCDDMVLLSRDRGELQMWKKKIEEFLSERLKLKLRDRYKLAPVNSGIDFLGYITRPGYILVRRRVVNNLKQCLNCYEKKLTYKKNGKLFLKYDYEVIKELLQVLSSYAGHFRLANSYWLRQGILKKYPWLILIIQKGEDIKRKNQLSPKWRKWILVRGDYKVFSSRGGVIHACAPGLQVSSLWKITLNRLFFYDRV